MPVAQVGTPPRKSKGSGIRFDRDGRMYVADFNNHNVFVFEPGQSTPIPYFHGSFDQPNDLAIAADGTLYASDPKRADRSARIWRIKRGSDGKGHGEVMIGRQNAHDQRPRPQPRRQDTLCRRGEHARSVGLPDRRREALSTNARLVAFGAPPPAFDLDGLRTNVNGLIYVTQNGAGKISVFTPQGQKAREPIKTVAPNPSNLTFGGPDGRTVFVTQVERGFIESFRVERPGREPCMQFGGSFCPPP